MSDLRSRNDSSNKLTLENWMERSHTLSKNS